MKQFNKWWNEDQSGEELEKFIDETKNIITQDQAIDALAKSVWQAALEFAIEEIIECLSPQDAIEILREELEGGE